MKKVCVITGTRAEYGLLRGLMGGLKKEEETDLQIIVTGAHLSPEFGLTYQEIEKDFAINKKVEMLLSSDTSVGIIKSMGVALMSFAEAYAELQPDCVIILGDRYEALSAASAAMVDKIPIIHLHGGETTEGAIDEAIRHAISKMAYMHFTATEAYRKRVVQLGEHPSRVFNVGALGVENIKQLSLLSQKDVGGIIPLSPSLKNILVTFHPTTLDAASAEEQFSPLLALLGEQKDYNVIFTKANSDVGGRKINLMIDDYVKRHPANSVSFVSLGQKRYLSLLQFVDVVVGNSSSGIIEVPSFKVGTINIGDRQKGRIKASSVVDAENSKQSIASAFKKVFSPKFQKSLAQVINPYENVNTSKKIIDILKKENFTKELKKSFYDVDFGSYEP